MFLHSLQLLYSSLLIPWFFLLYLCFYGVLTLLYFLLLLPTTFTSVNTHSINYICMSWYFCWAIYDDMVYLNTPIYYCLMLNLNYPYTNNQYFHLFIFHTLIMLSMLTFFCCCVYTIMMILDIIYFDVFL